MIITTAESLAFWQADAEPLLAQIPDELTSWQGAAMVSFGYNCGAAAMRRVLLCPSHMVQYVHDHQGDILQGLVTRRALESALYENT